MHVFGDLVVFLDDDAADRARTARRGSTTSPASAYTQRRRGLHRHAGRSSPTCSQEWQTAGLTGFRLRPGALPARPDRRSPAAWCPSCSAAARSAPPTRPDTLRGLLGLPRPANRYAHRELRTTDEQARKQIHLAAHFPGVNNTTVWSDPAAGSHIEFGSFAHFAQTAERAKFDFLFLAEGLRLREQNGQIYDLDVVGRPDTFTVLPRWPPSPTGSG